ncbi:inactive protein tyrosine kinase pTKL-like [Tribolium madens]|uniref:inactive protein tyrosine kinase pTKL-like n=1 Tax=Tribolium madens TaxID=41895 RepID=UPI001CF75BB0|nr:inactive protein tyrosine kinase pTKL-like [Tribolium madens]
MVRLKRCSEMSVLKNISMRMEGLPETEVWVALMKTAVSFNSLNSFYDGFYYKNDIGINNISRNQLSLRVSGGRNVLLKFGSPGTMEEFCKSINYIEGIDAPCPSPVSSPTPSPPESTPSLSPLSSPTPSPPESTPSLSQP